jgi:hypothetical protein
MFEQERATYEKHKGELLQFEGRYVVIRGDEILGNYPTIAEAFSAGIKAYGPDQFFLHRISKDESGLFNPFIGCVTDPTFVYPV